MSEWGFRPEDLTHYGVSTCSRDWPTSLSDWIHPIFAHDRFTHRTWQKVQNDFLKSGTYGAHPSTKMNQVTYDQLRPALQLASLFIANSLDFYGKLIYGARTTDPKTGLVMIGEIGQGDNPKVASTVARLARDDLQNLAPYIQFAWGSPRDANDQPVRAHASTMIVGFTVPPTHPNLKKPALIMIHEDTLTYLQRDLPSATPCQRQRFFFQLATTLAHEVVHAVNKLQDSYQSPMQRNPQHNIPEPLFSANDPDVELGLAWETFFFGKKLQPFPGHAQGQMGFLAFDWGNMPAVSRFKDFPHLQAQQVQIQKSAGSRWKTMRVVQSDSISSFFDGARWVGGPGRAGGFKGLEIVFAPIQTCNYSHVKVLHWRGEFENFLTRYRQADVAGKTI